MRPDLREPGSAGDASLWGGLAVVQNRLRFQRSLDGAAFGGWLGVGLSGLWLAGWLLRLAPLPHPALLLIAPAVGLLLSAALAVRSFRPTETELALVVDRLLGSREAVVTSLGAGAGRLAGRVHRDAQRALEDAAPRLRAGLPLRPPRRLLALPLGILLLAAATLLPRAPERLTPAGPAGDPTAEAERPQDRKETLERELGVELPEDLDAEFAELIDAMKRGGDAEALAEQAQDLAEKLDRHREELSQGGAAEALQQAADALADADGEAARDLEDAAAQGDLDAAKDAIDRMRERMKNQPERQQEQAARELEKAAERASAGGMPGLGDALREEARKAREARRGAGGSGNSGQGEGPGQQGGQGGQEGSQSSEDGQKAGQEGNGQGGQQGSQGGQQGQGEQSGQGGGAAGQGGGQQAGDGAQQRGGGQSGGQGGGLGEYLEQLDQQGLGGDGLAQQQQQMEMSQGLGQALGGAAGRVGKGQMGRGGRGNADGTGWGAGSEHTDEDKGNHQTDGQGFQDMDRQVEGRTSHWTTEYGQDHEEKRLEGVDALATSVAVPLGDGPVDVETMRLRGSDERSGSPLLQAPPGYREAAEEAIQGEGIPRHYRDQVKNYFDAIR